MVGRISRWKLSVSWSKRLWVKLEQGEAWIDSGELSIFERMLNVISFAISKYSLFKHLEQVKSRKINEYYWTIEPPK